ncbi:MAG: Hsp20/alpha crystallin family protein [Spirochaetota bacterium]
MADTAVEKQETKQAVERRTVRPLGNICEASDAVVLRLEMPGVSKDGIDVNIDGNTLTVHGRRNAYADDVSYVIHERRDADYRATYTLDERVDREKVDAKMENGILTVRLHLKDEVKPRKIEVKTG